MSFCWCVFSADFPTCLYPTLLLMVLCLLQMSLRGPAPLTVVQLPGEQVQVQGVIQTAQSSSVIHSPQVQTVQVTQNGW